MAADGRDRFPEDVGRGDAADAQAREGLLGGRAAGDDEAHPRGRASAGFVFGLDADAAAAQLPGDVGGAVLVGEQLVGGEHQGRVGGDQRPQAGQRRRVGGRADRRVGEGEQRADAGGRGGEAARSRRPGRFLAHAAGRATGSSSGSRIVSAASGAAISIALAAV